MLTKLKQLGSVDLAHEVAQKTEKLIPAYQQFVKDQNFDMSTPFSSRPLMEKSNYIDKYDFESLLIPNRNNIISYHRSSGFSKKSTYWPASNEGIGFIPKNEFLQSMSRLYNIDQNRIMHLIAFSLGSWVGGESIGINLKNIFSAHDFPSIVYTPGNDYRDGIETLIRFQDSFDLFIIYITPSSISDFFMTAKSLQLTLPLEKMRFIVGGEMFPESLRTQIAQGVPGTNQFKSMISLYGSADTGVIALESEFSAAIRQILQNDHIRKTLGFEGLPLLHHQLSKHYYAEEVNGQMIMTLWQGIPLVRYNLKDRVDLLSWKELLTEILSMESDAPEFQEQFDFLKNAPHDLPDILAIYGRADRGVILSGSNISENILNQAIRTSVAKITQGKYQAEVVFGKYQNQRLSVTIEVPNLEDMTHLVSLNIQKNITQNLCQLQSEFEHDYSKRFCDFDDDPERSIVTVQFVQWPYFSEKNAGQIKHKVIG